MEENKYVYGPVPSRRMGISLGISPIKEKSCSYSCIYCQLGRTKNMMYERAEFVNINDVINEFKMCLKENIKFDVVTIVGEGEPTLFSRLEELIDEVKKLTDKPIAVITNGSLLFDECVRNALKKADLVLPSLDAGNEEMFIKINRPHGRIKFKNVIYGLKKFANEYDGQLWMETMIVKGFNDSEKELLDIKKILDSIKYDRLYVNTPVRPPAEEYAKEPSDEGLERALSILGGISIDKLVSKGFYSDTKDDLEAIISIISRHPMNNFEIKSFLETRECENIENIFSKLNNDASIEKIEYKNYTTYRIK
ncbi:cyclic pyranopterin monophosphate synthase [Clostridium tepidiprofundi DSM 19306]|uniref:Cyclic pyranopterin monophosphate synthase n=1 Tax=Clostridium tepidiprofundi DSM 19306 TaxID=1121338 RepID=A0A151B2S0_9CLOT|nr:radical SAM protein [Clostridium tepidiprofundi]KYH34208.1 cyclic pyranopterin monophosphate synthase [Clostridium tepidiprofundi DSM 19306]